MKTLACALLPLALTGCLFISVGPDDGPDPGITDGGPGDVGYFADGCVLPDRDYGDWIDVDTEPCVECDAPPPSCL